MEWRGVVDMTRRWEWLIGTDNILPLFFTDEININTLGDLFFIVTLLISLTRLFSSYCDVCALLDFSDL